MSRISITLDVTKFNKSKIVERKFKNRDGKEVVVKEYKVDLVELKEPKVLKETDTYILKKTHFVAEQQTKEERASKAPTVYVGEGAQFVDKKPQEGVDQSFDTGTDTINDDDIPF